MKFFIQQRLWVTEMGDGSVILTNPKLVEKLGNEEQI